jgi:hypothetical protein
MSPDTRFITHETAGQVVATSGDYGTGTYGEQDYADPGVPAAKARKQAKWDRAMRREGNRSFANPNRHGHRI